MATSKTTAQPPASENALLEPVFQIQRVYLKEVSLEQPNSPAIFLETEQPQLNIQLSIDHQQIVEGIYEVSVLGNVHTVLKEKTIFLIEVKQAAIFEIRNLPPDQLNPILSIACPQIIYPYLRSNLADVITRAGFPPVHLAEVNFQAMYEQQQAELKNTLSDQPAANE